MRALVARLTGKSREDDPINIHVTVFWATIAFWVVVTGCFAVAKAIS